MSKEADSLMSAGSVLFLIFMGLAAVTPWFIVISLFGLAMLLAGSHMESQERRRR